MRNRINYSQNFLKDERLVSELVAASSISSSDLVYEIGAGEGIITRTLGLHAKKVISYEIDAHFYTKLKDLFKKNTNIEIRNEDFMKVSLPTGPYKVFSNIPFNITASIIKKLTSSSHPPMEMYLILQKEAAAKFVGKPLDRKNSQISILLQPYFEYEVIHQFKRTDFFPVGRVDSILLRITKRHTPLVKAINRRTYEDFVVHTFNQFKPNVSEGLSPIIDKGPLVSIMRELKISAHAKPSELSLEQWLGLFTFFVEKVDLKKQQIISGAAAKQQAQQQGLQKINRTRVDSSWKKFKK